MNENRRILVVDDNEAIHEDFKKVLVGGGGAPSSDLSELERQIFGEAANPGADVAGKALGFTVDSAFQGQQALQMVEAAHARGEPYAMLFVDMRMPPGWDGITTIKNIWKKFPDTEVVICTAYSDYSSDDIINELGVTDKVLILKKPFDPVAVNQMALAITTKWNLRARLNEYIGSLENQVQERTAKLNDLVRELKQSNGELESSFTRLRETQEMLLQSSKMSALGEMAGGVAHEINNPLAIINTLAGHIRDLVQEEPVDKTMLAELAQKVENTVLRIAKVVAALRSFSRDGGKDPFLRATVRGIVDEVLDLCSERFKSHSVAIQKADIPESLSIECRETQVAQVLLNLLNNSFDAICDQKDKWVKIEVEDAGESVRVLVTDSGGGIPPAVRDKLFHPFFTTKPIGKGTGIGLSISKGIVEAHNGTLVIDASCPNTRFVITLPKRQAGAAPRAA